MLQDFKWDFISLPWPQAIIAYFCTNSKMVILLAKAKLTDGSSSNIFEAVEVTKMPSLPLGPGSLGCFLHENIWRKYLRKIFKPCQWVCQGSSCMGTCRLRPQGRRAQQRASGHLPWGPHHQDCKGCCQARQASWFRCCFCRRASRAPSSRCILPERTKMNNGTLVIDIISH